MQVGNIIDRNFIYASVYYFIIQRFVVQSFWCDIWIFTFNPVKILFMLYSVKVMTAKSQRILFCLK